MLGRQQPVIGLDVGSSAVKLVHFSEKGGDYTLEHYGICELDPDAIVDGAVMDAGHVADSIRQLVESQKIRQKQVAISVSGNSVIVKKIHVPIMEADELAESIAWEAEQYIPFEINDVNLDFHILEGSDEAAPSGQMAVLLVAAKKDRVNELVALVEEAGLKPVIVDVDAFGLENIFCTNYGVGDRVTGLVNIGASVININILIQGMSAFTRDISTGGDRITEDIQKSLNISVGEAERAKRGELIPGIDPEQVLSIIQQAGMEIAAEVGRTFDYFKTTAQVGSVDRVLLSGGASRTPGLADQIAERLGLPAQLFNPFEHIHLSPSIDAGLLVEAGAQLGVAAGLAFRRVNDR
jgi:type IV pilus assembly protein PilM